MKEDFYEKWCIARVIIKFKKLKGCVITSNKKKMIYPGERFKPLISSLEFKFMGYVDKDNPPYYIDTYQGDDYNNGETIARLKAIINA